MIGRVSTYNDIEQLDLAAVDREIGASGRALKFAPVVEAAFHAETRQSRVGTSLIAAIIALVLYDIFLINDWQILHDRFGCMVILRLGVFTPFAMVMIYGDHRLRSAWLADWGGAMVAILAIALPMTTMIFSHSPDRLSYQFGSLLVMMYVTAIQRVRFRPSAVGLVAMMAVQLATTYASHIFTRQAYAANTLFFSTALLLLLLTSYLLERDDRRVFLLGLRGRLLNQQIVEAARRDDVTGLYNRTHLAEITSAIWSSEQTECRPVSVIMVDIDHFKLFNDTCGHLQGDECLQTVSAVIAAASGTQGVFRFGGEEILILLPDVDHDAALERAAAIRAAIETAAIPHPGRGKDAVVTASLGVGSGLAPLASARDLIASADAALYAAKKAGRNCVWSYARLGDTPALAPESWRKSA